ncbi:hypothetical protein ACOMHN_054758 [Nucella lapillus]
MDRGGGDVRSVVVWVQVELEVADDERTVTVVHIKGWRVDGVMMEVLTQCWAALQALHTLQLWNTALDDHSLSLLVAGLVRCPRLTTLTLDNNPLAHLPIASLLARSSFLENLSLRWCGLTDTDMRGMALVLGSALGANTALLSLDLSGNRVGDAGVGYLAEALQLNRVLLVLNLSSNRVSSAGVARLAEALSWFRVPEDLQEVRKSLINKELAKYIVIKEKPKSSTIVPYEAAKGAQRSGRATLTMNGPKNLPRNIASSNKLKKDLTVVTYLEKTAKKEPRRSSCRKKKMSLCEESLPQKQLVVEVDPELRVCAPRVRPSWYTEGDTEVLSYGRHPLLQAGFIHQGELWLPANRTLGSLNLARNQIGEKGVEALLTAVEEQVIPPEYGDGRGLRRLVLHLNPINPHSEEALALGRLLAVRDPLYRLPIIDLQKVYISPCAIPVRAAI